jgi:hypothetical protein
MFAAAGIVVTLISTPIRAPDLAVERLSMPAAPAQQATKAAKKSGLAIVWDNEWLAALNASGVMSVALKTSELRMTAPMASGNPTASAASDRAASSGRRWTVATQTPAIGPNSGPTTIAPTMRIAEFR